MGLIREPLDVDFFVDPRPLTDNEKKMISDFIKADKEKRKNKKTSKKGTYTQSSRLPHQKIWWGEPLTPLY
ncbi:MAG: hypothetical protein COZ59_00035, partial [Bacteroidetes bacterium CG_4_8_14_3_um_filter_31_14]